MAVHTSQGWTLMFYGVLPCKNALRVAYSVLPRLLVAVVALPIYRVLLSGCLMPLQ
jgi:integral membrane sensor domain MASE1